MPYRTIIEPFRIHSVEGVDDYAAIREVVLRRYRYAAEGEASGFFSEEMVRGAFRPK